MTDYFWMMTETLKDNMLLRDNIFLGLFLWAVLPITILMYLGWFIADLTILLFES